MNIFAWLQTIPPRVRAAAQRLPDSAAADDPRVRELSTCIDQHNREQATARAAVAQAQALLDAVPERRKAAEDALHQVEGARTRAAEAALLSGDDREYHQACFSVTKAERTVQMFDFGVGVLEAEVERRQSVVRAIGAKGADLSGQLADAVVIAKVALVRRQPAA